MAFDCPVPPGELADCDELEPPEPEPDPEPEGLPGVGEPEDEVEGCGTFVIDFQFTPLFAEGVVGL